MLEVGDSFVLKNTMGKHLHVIVAEASGAKNGQVMLVYLTSAKNFRDTTTIIKYGEHPFVTKVDEVSWIKYQNILIIDRDKLQKSIVKSYGKVTHILLERIQHGIEQSDFVSKKNKRLFNEWHLDRLYRNKDF